MDNIEKTKEELSLELDELKKNYKILKSQYEKDIADRIQSEERIRKSEEMHRLLIENSHDIIYTLSADGLFTFVSNAWTVLLGHNVNQVVGQSFQKFVHPDDILGCMDWLQKVIETGQRQEGVEYRVQHINGKWCWHTSSAVPIKNEESIIIGFEGTARDISERKKAEDALRASEEQFKMVTENFPDGMIVLHDYEKRYIFADGLVLAELGLSKEMLIDKKPQDIFPTEFCEQLNHHIDNAFKGNKEIFEINLGLNYFTETVLPVKNKNGEIAAVMGVIHNITDRKKAEKLLQFSRERLEEAQKIARIGNWEANLVTDELYWSQVIFEIFGFDSNTFKPSVSAFYDAIHPDDKELVFESERHSEETGLHDVVHRIILTNTKEIRYVHELAKRYSDDKGNLIMLRGTVQDITERKLIEESLRVSENMFRSYIENAPIGVFVCNEMGKYVQVNPAASAITGYSQEELLELSIPDILPTHSQILAGQYFQEVSETGWTSAEFEFLHKDGKIGIWALEGVKLSLTRYMGLVTDITERKRVEKTLYESRANLSAIIDNTTDSIWAVNTSYELICINDIFKKSFLESFGIQLDVGINILEAAPEYMSQEWKPRYYRAFQNERFIFEQMFDFGSIIVYLEIAVNPIVVDNKVIGASVFSRDITQRKLADFEIREKEVQYRNLANSGMALIWNAGNDKLCFYFNDTWLKFTGRTLEQEMGNGWAEGVHPEDLDRCLDTYVTAFDKRESFSMEYRLLNASGEYRWLLDLGTPNYNSLGEFVGYIGHCFDITERKQVEEKLLLINKAIDSTSDAVGISDAHGNHFYQNKAMSDLFEYASAKDIESAGGGAIVVKDPEVANEMFGNIMSGKSWSGELDMVTKSGRVFPAYERADAIKDAEGNIIGLIGIITDITERKKAEVTLRASEEKLIVNEKRLSYALNATSDAIWEWDYNTGKTFYSSRWYEMLGYEGEEFEMNFDTWESLCHPDDFPSTVEKINSVIKNPESKGYNAEFRMKHKDGSWVWILGRGNVVKRDENQNPLQLSGTNTDITERKQAEEKQRESEENFRALFESAKDGIFQISSNGEFIGLNKSFAEMHGYTLDELMNMNLNDLDTPETSKLAPERMQRLLAGEPMTFEVEHFCKNGERIPIEASANLVNIGNKKYVLGFHRDISERKLAEQKLRESEYQYRMLFNANKDSISIFSLNPDGNLSNFIEMNDATTEIFDRTKEELIMMNIKDLEADVSVEDRHHKVEDLQSKGSLNFETIINDKAGNYKYLDVKVVLINYRNQPALMNISRDITERKLMEQKIRDSEEKLITLFQSMTEMVALHELVFDEQGKAINYRIIDCNNSYTEITGILKENVVGKLATEVYQTEYAPYLEEYSQVAISGKSYKYTTYFQPMDKHFSISVVSPKTNHFATITTDITAIKQIEEVITAKNKELENYLYIASHDLRSPLVNIQGFSQRLQKKVDAIKNIISDSSLDEKTKLSIDSITNDSMPKTLDFIYTNVTKMDNLINGLLQISRTGRIVMTIRKIDMNKLFETIVNAKKFQIHEISAIINIANLPECYGDENLLNQLFSNLLANAFNYRDKNRQLVIDITALTLYNKNIYCIKDNGIGIAQRHIEKIWDVFYRVNSGSKVSGEGIGLSIVKRITDKHKGKVIAESVEGKGSIFYIELLKNEFAE